MVDEEFFTLKIPSTNAEDENVFFELGTSTIFVGANGSEKTRRSQKLSATPDPFGKVLQHVIS